MTAHRVAHVPALMTLMEYVVSKNSGLLSSLNEKWIFDFKFKVNGRSDSNYAKNPETCRSLFDGREFVNGVHLGFCIQDTGQNSSRCNDDTNWHVYCLLELIGLEIDLPISSKMNNLGAANIANCWCVEDCTHHVSS